MRGVQENGDIALRLRPRCSSSDELNRTPDRRFHPRRIGNSLSCDRKGRAMIRRCADVWQSKRDVRCFAMRDELYGNQPLIVIRRNHDIELAGVSPEVEAVGGMRSRHRNPFRLALAYGGCQDIDVLSPEYSTFACVGIDRRDGDARLREVFVDESNQANIVIAGDLIESVSQRNVNRAQNDFERRCEKRHRVLRHLRSFSEEVRLTAKISADGCLVNGRRHQCGNVSGESFRACGFQICESTPSGVGTHLSPLDACQ